MNYIREARNYLEHYGNLHKSVENIDKEISRLIRKSGPSDITGISYDMEKVQSGGCDDIMDVMFQIQTLTANRKETSEKLKEVDDLLNDLEKEYQYYGNVLRKWYIERMSKEDIAGEIGYSSRSSIYTLESKAIRVFAVRLFGIKVVEML